MKSTIATTRVFWWVSFCALLILIALFGSYWLRLERGYVRQLDEAAAAARLRAEETAHALARQIQSQLHGIDFIAEHLGARWQEQDLTSFNALIARAERHLGQGALELVAITDDEGHLLYAYQDSLDNHAPRLSVADRPYFQEHKAHNKKYFSISAPVRNKVTGSWTIQFTHSMYRDGEFQGVVLLSVSTRFLAGSFRQVYPDPHNLVVLSLSDGTVLIRSHEPEWALEKIEPPEPRDSHGFFEALDTVDGIERYYSWYRLDDYPLVLNLGLGKAKVLGPVLDSIDTSRRQNLQVSAVLILAAMLVFYLGMLKSRQTRRLERAQERLSTLITYFPAGVLLEDENNHIVTLNRRLCSMLELAADSKHLEGLHHAELLELLQEDQLHWLPAAKGNKRQRQSAAVSGRRGQTFEVSWIPIWQRGRSLGHVWLVQDISEYKRKEDELLALANTDPLTGLPNRRSFQGLLEARLNHLRDQAPGALLMLDIDHFKHVNDSWGHPVGDEVLQHVANIIDKSLRREDHAGRLGGEEFAVLLQETTPEQSLQLAERLRKRIEDTPAQTKIGMVRVTVSIGLCMLYVQEQHNQDLHNILVRADRALYQAKEQGRNRVCVADGSV